MRAFRYCSLTEVIIPPSVETIGASAFAGNTKLSTIVMGHQLKSIGEKAYDGCPVETVHITAPTPPNAPNNTFSRYSGKLWVVNNEALDAYYDAYTCWDRFDSYAMIEPESIKIEGESLLNASPDDTIYLSATIEPENVTLPHIFWRSTNPAIATVDNNGMVIIHALAPDVQTLAQGDDNIPSADCHIIAESLYANAPVAKISLNAQPAGIDNIIADRPQTSAAIDYSEPYDVYNFNGMMIGHTLDNLQPGLYIIRQGAKAAKILK